MNDLQTLRATLATDEPSQDVVDRSRHQLQNRMRGGPAARKRTGWLVVGTGLTVAAAAAAVIAISAVPDTPVNGSVDGPSATTVSGPEVLLAAATAAERTPEGSGTYWYVKITTQGDVYETWTKPDGQWWLRGEQTNGEVMPMKVRNSNPFSLAGAELTLDELRALPAEPEALKAWIADAIEHGDAMTSAGPLKDVPDLLEQAKFDSLISVVSELPAPPEVRAAAFRAIASYPGVESLGDVPGGQGLLLPGDQRFVVDPATGRVNGTSVLVAMDGSRYGTDDPAGIRISAEWINALPA